MPTFAFPRHRRTVYALPHCLCIQLLVSELRKHISFIAEPRLMVVSRARPTASATAAPRASLCDQYKFRQDGVSALPTDLAAENRLQRQRESPLRTTCIAARYGVKDLETDLPPFDTPSS